MHESIAFPNLGIEFEHVGKSISVFGFEIAYYGMIIGLAILIGFAIATAEAKRTRQNPEDYMDMGLIGVICGIAGARIYYIIFSWEMYKDDLLSVFNLREGGLAIYGGIIGAILSVLVCAKVKRLSAPQILDTVAMALVNGQMLGRWGNFFNREVFGGYTDSLFAMRLPLDAVRSRDVTEEMRQYMDVIDGVCYIQVHPTFLYESLWCCGVLLFLFFYRKHKKYEGELFLPGTTLPVSQVLAAGMVVVTGALLLYLRKHHKRLPLLRAHMDYKPMPPKIEGNKKPRSRDRLFKNME